LVEVSGFSGVAPRAWASLESARSTLVGKVRYSPGVQGAPRKTLLGAAAQRLPLMVELANT
jgi:hypothetical protein